MGVKKFVTCRYDASKNLGSPCSGDASFAKVKLRRQMPTAAGKKSTTYLSLFMEHTAWKWEKELSTTATQYWAEGEYGHESGVTSKKKLG